MAMSPGGQLLVVGRADGHLVTVRARDGSTVQDWPAHKSMVNVVRISPDGKRLVSGAADNEVQIAELRSDGAGWEHTTTLKCGGEILGAAISPDGAFLVTTNRTTSMRIWSFPNGQLLREIALEKTPWKLSFSPDGEKLAVGSWDRSIEIW